MALPDKTLKAIEEFKEAGHDQRYREQLMVQEFGFTMVVMTLLVNALNKELHWTEELGIGFFGFLFLILLVRHLRNLNEDRAAAMLRKVKLSKQLGFQVIHQNPDGKHRSRASGAMIRFAEITLVLWAVWGVLRLFSQLIPET